MRSWQSQHPEDERAYQANAKLAFENAALRNRVEALTEQLADAKEERELLEQERDLALLKIEELETKIDRLGWRLQIAHGQGDRQ